MMRTLSALAVLLLLAGCVNVHVHFPKAPDAQPSKPAAAGDNDKK